MAPATNVESPSGGFEARTRPLPGVSNARSVMQSALPILAATLIALPFIAPFFAPTFPDSGDGLLNLYRVVALDFSIQNGDLWPRFNTALHYGFGSPIFNYYAPLSIYAVEVIHLLGFEAPDAYRLAMMLFGLIGAVGAYLLGRAAAGNLAGWVTAAAYLYAPPLFDSFNRTGQFAAILMLPYILWAFWRLAVYRCRRDFVIATLLFAALLLTHNVTALYAAPMAAVWAIYVGWRVNARWQTMLLPILALIAALGLTAFFWWPALAEADFVQLNRLDIPQFDYHANFLPLAQTFAPPISEGRIGSPYPQTIGWPQLLLALAGLLLIFFQSRLAPASNRERHRASGLAVPPRDWAIFAVLIFLIAVFCTTGASVWLWDHLPLIDLLLFPARILYAASLMLALLAGIGAALVANRIPHPVGQAAWVAACITILIAHQLPNLVTHPVEKPAAATVHDIHDFERNTGWIGATSAGEFLPIWVKQVPHAWALTDRLYTSSTPPRLQANEAIADIRTQTWGDKSVSMVFITSEPTTLIFEWLYFPGWEATLDGRPVELRPTDPEGLIALDIPAGDHDLSLRFASTPTRRSAGWLSLASLVLLIIGLIASYYWRRSI